MKRLLFVVIAAGVLAVGCRTTEANYRAAYERTMEARRAGQSVDSTVYGDVRRQASAKTEAVAPGVTAEVISQLVRVTEGGGGTREKLHRYCVVAGQFKQKFNALSLRERLVAAGCPGAFVVETAEPYYYIITGSYDTLAEAYDAMQALKAEPPVSMKSPLPFILNATAR